MSNIVWLLSSVAKLEDFLFFFLQLDTHFLSIDKLTICTIFCHILGILLLDVFVLPVFLQECLSCSQIE